MNADWCVRATIIRWVCDEPEPGLVETRLTDRLGNHWFFVTKYYDVTDAEPDAESGYPMPGFIGCILLLRDKDAEGRETVLIDTDAFDRGYEAVDGTTRFEVYADQPLPSPDWQQWKAVSLRPLH